MLDIQGRKYAPITVCDVTLYDTATNYPVMYFDTLKVTNLDGTAEVTEVQGGKGNPVLVSISHSKAVNVTFDDAIMTMASLAVLTGGELRQSTGSSTITFRENEILNLEETDTDITLSKNAKAGSYVYIGKIINGVLGTVTRTEDALTEGKVNIDLADFYNFDTDNTEGRYRVFYETELGWPTSAEEVEELTVWADRFAGTYRFVGDTVLYNQQSGANDIFQIEIPRLMLDSTYSLNLNASAEAVVFSFSGKALRDDEGKVVMFRKLAIADMDTRVQLDGSYPNIPAKGVSVGEDGELTHDSEHDKPVPGSV